MGVWSTSILLSLGAGLYPAMLFCIYAFLFVKQLHFVGTVYISSFSAFLHFLAWDDNGAEEKFVTVE